MKMTYRTLPGASASRTLFGALIAGGILGLGLAACSDSTGPVDGQSQVSIAFRTAGPGGAAAVAPESGEARPGDPRIARSVSLSRSNGTLTLDEVWLIVAEFELEREHDDDCDDGVSGSDDECEEFEAPPRFISLDLEGGVTPVVTQAVPADVYDELEFEIEDIDFDEDDEDELEIQALAAEIRVLFPDWPDDASGLVVGSFTPTGGSAIPFRVFLEAEVEIEQEFEPALDLTNGDATVTVVVDPGLWFARPDGTVLDLSQFDGQMIEFEVEIEHGFEDLEFDDDDDDD